jgi:hypothetical protein
VQALWYTVRSPALFACRYVVSRYKILGTPLEFSLTSCTILVSSRRIHIAGPLVVVQLLRLLTSPKHVAKWSLGMWCHCALLGWEAGNLEPTRVDIWRRFLKISKAVSNVSRVYSKRYPSVGPLNLRDPPRSIYGQNSNAKSSRDVCFKDHLSLLQ